MLLKPDFFYSPFCAAWGTVPPDTAEVYTARFPALAAVPTKLKAEIVPVMKRSEVSAFYECERVGSSPERF